MKLVVDAIKLRSWAAGAKAAVDARNECAWVRREGWDGEEWWTDQEGYSQDTLEEAVARWPEYPVIVDCGHGFYLLFPKEEA